MHSNKELNARKLFLVLEIELWRSVNSFISTWLKPIDWRELKSDLEVLKITEGLRRLVFVLFDNNLP